MPSDFIALAKLDTYSRRARLQPALLAILPAAISAVSWLPGGLKDLDTLVGFLASAGGVVLLAHLARIRGKRIEPDLFAGWGGAPSTVALQHRATKNTVLLLRRHVQLAKIVDGINLPTEAEERQNPQAADAAYGACAAVLIERTRDRQRFPLLFAENCSYGFWRNLLGLRWVGVACSILGIAAAGIAMYRHHDPLEVKAVAAAAIDLLFLLGWLFVVRESTVRIAAQAYSDRLLGACEELEKGP